jgi:hypothetical protein
MKELALSRAPKHFVRVNDELCIDKVVQFYSSLLYILTLG